MKSPLPTMTLAEMYVRQGLAGRARKILRQIAEGEDPRAAEAARRRLAELGPSAEAPIAMLQKLLERVERKRRLV